MLVPALTLREDKSNEDAAIQNGHPKLAVRDRIAEEVCSGGYCETTKIFWLIWQNTESLDQSLHKRFLRAAGAMRFIHLVRERGQRGHCSQVSQRSQDSDDEPAAAQLLAILRADNNSEVQLRNLQVLPELPQGSHVRELHLHESK